MKHLSSYYDRLDEPVMMKKSTIDYREKIFEHPKLSKMIGVPNYDTLNILHNEKKHNRMEVRSNLGGGQHG